MRDQLQAAGLALIPQFGSSGYYIDFAVQDPEHPGKMVLAIECDGVRYHSSPTARDRDRLRQEQLERLGWRFHRIWSTSWSREREGEVQRTLAAYQEALAASRQPARRSVTASRLPESPDDATHRRTTQRRRLSKRSPLGEGRGQLSRLTCRSMRTVNETLCDCWPGLSQTPCCALETSLSIELIEVIGRSRRGSRILAACTDALDAYRSLSEDARRGLLEVDFDQLQLKPDGPRLDQTAAVTRPRLAARSVASVVDGPADYRAWSHPGRLRWDRRSQSAIPILRQIVDVEGPTTVRRMCRALAEASACGDYYDEPTRSVLQACLLVWSMREFF